MGRRTRKSFVSGAALAALLLFTFAVGTAEASRVVTRSTAPSEAHARPAQSDHFRNRPLDEPFQHPGVMLGEQQVAFVKAKLDAGAEPWRSGFKDLKASRYASLGWLPKPRAVVECGQSSHPNNGCSDERDDSMAAYTDALQWLFTRDDRYAHKAIQIMDAWSAVIQKHTNTNAPLQTGWSGINWARAAELIRHSEAGWPAPSVDRFSNMLRIAYVPQLAAGSPRKNGNWELIETDALMSIAVFLDDHQMFQQAVEMWRDRLPAYVYLKTDGPQPVAPPKAGITGRNALIHYWQGQTTFVNGLAQETCRDFGHTGWGLEAAAQTAETARLQGLDLWAEGKQRLVKALEFHTSYDNGTKAPGWLCGGAVKSGLGPAVQLAYNHYHLREGIPMPQTQRYVAAHRSFPANYFIGWETLTDTNAP
ncbi:alginate lyase family protein [Streptomyces sp. NPDC006668]|uniref:alginate lyase family protein n=1 Tax=Streptomyces sp. NPDC006668 TaxID=3156903 RepID=UPI0033E1A30F